MYRDLFEGKAVQNEYICGMPTFIRPTTLFRAYQGIIVKSSAFDPLAMDR